MTTKISDEIKAALLAIPAKIADRVFGARRDEREVARILNEALVKALSGFGTWCRDDQAIGECGTTGEGDGGTRKARQR